ncbi:hypothetical protein Tco_0709858 [Tanacetum coccineum]
MKTICNLDMPVDSKAPKPSLQTEEVPKFGQGQKPKPHSPPTPVVGEMHKEARQAAGGPTSLGATSEEGSHPQLSSGHDASVDSTAEVNPGISALRIPYLKNKIKPNLLEMDESKEEEYITKDKDTEATSHDEPKDTSVPLLSPKLAQIQELMAQVHLLQSQKEDMEQAKAKAEAEVASMKAKPLYLDITQLTELLVTSLKPELSKLLASYDFSSYFPTELKELP